MPLAFLRPACATLVVAAVLIASSPTRARQSPPAPSSSLPSRDAVAMQRVAQRIAAIAEETRLTTVGAAIVRGGRLVWTTHAGDESPGVAASAQTRFNVASITKLVTAETVLRLADQGRLSLDEPMSAYWVDPDVSGDARHLRLTARMALAHVSGLPNWRFFQRDGKLRFLHDPGTRYGYSGEGIEYLARYTEAKLGLPFPALVDEQVFEPLQIRAARLRIERDAPAHLARPVDEDGAFHGNFCRPGGWCREHGSYSAADDLAISVVEFARFLIAVADTRGYGDATARERDRVQGHRGDETVVRCATSSAPACPHEQGYGLGFEVLDYGDTRVIGHGGSDWSEMSLAYAYLPARDGVILFVNAPNRRALEAMPDLLEALDPASPYLQQYRRWRVQARESAQLR
jgi:CubicO group peptidase (beta-lactamase class C family)